MWVVIQLVVAAALLSDYSTAFAQQQLPRDDTSIQDIVAKFEQLEAQVHQLQTNDVVQMNLIERLKEEVDRVNEKYAVQEIIIQSLLKGKEDDVNKRTAISSFSSADSRLYSMPRSCNEAKSLDPTLSSGYYYVDPDGTNIGDSPINVYCDMTTGSTMVSHDSEATTDVGNCANAGCYSKQIKYNATLRQMVALSEISTTCQQSIRYDCFVAPLEFNGVQESWWNDRNNVPRYFWSGVNTNQHTCQCGIDKNCVDPSLKCNCDSGAALQLVDNGILTDKNLLPVTRLNFGRTPAGSNGRHTLGKFQCTGRAAVQGKPTSCRQLFQIGHELNGFYMVQGDKRIETVYCDFTQSPEAYETRIGYNDIKSSPVYFYVGKNATYDKNGTTIPFEIERLNIGGAMNLATGVFTAPRPGRYLFSLSGLPNVDGTRVQIRLNGARMGQSYADIGGTFSLDSIIHLKVGDIVTLFLDTGAIYDWGAYTHFIGVLLEEDLIF